jgi:hypothetical protein
MRGVDMLGAIDAAADKGAASPIEHKESGAGSIGALLK